MKKREITHWTKNKYLKGMLLFAQAIEEETFNYSYESYKVPALNSHYLCYDVIQTASDINKKILMDGNFVPLSEEFEQMLQEDIFVQQAISDDGTLLFSQDKTSRYYNLEESELKTKIKHYPEVAHFVKDICETNEIYLEILLDIIIDNIFVEPFSYDNSEKIYHATRMLATELINAGYSKEYIYFTVLDTFFTSTNPVTCSKDTVVNFFNNFTFEKYDYQAIFGINQKAASVLGKLESLNIQKSTIEQRKQLNLQRQNDYVVIIHIQSIDAFSAFEQANQYMQAILSLHRINQHDSRLFVTSKAIISKGIDNVFESENVVHTPINAMKKRGNSSDLHAIFSDITLMNKIELPVAFYKSIRLHSGAIESKDISNQLLNLWTIIETLIDSKRDNEDKINTICIVLCSVLNRCYMYDNIEQLLRDICTCASVDISNIISRVESDDQELDMVERLVLLLSLNENADLLDEVINALCDYPLLVYRLKLFSQHVFIDSKSIYDYLQRHKKRIRWHIMRIYRNRNMIVHSGSYMPYLSIIIENLHYYVDVLFDTLIEYYHFGLVKHTSIYRDILSKETSYYAKLGINIKSTKSKEKQQVIPISKENALELILNGYSGNAVKKALNQVIEEQRNEVLMKSSSSLLTSMDSGTFSCTK